MNSARPYRITITQIAAVVGSTLALLFVVAFVTRAMDAYRLRAWRDRLRVEIEDLQREREALYAELERRQTYAWVDEQLRDMGMVPEGVVSVIAVPAGPEPDPGAPVGEDPAARPTPPAQEAGEGGWFRNAHWEAWQRLIWGFDTPR
jgi:hypothetical protein